MPITDNLVSHWSLEESSGARVDDNGANNLTDNNSCGQSVGKVGNCVHMNSASSQYLSHIDTATLRMGAGVRMTIAGWVYADSLPGSFDTIMAKRNATVFEYDLYYHVSAGQLKFTASPDGTFGNSVTVASTFGALSTATWYFVVGEYDGANLKISVNNGAFDTQAYASDVFSGTQPFYVGQDEANDLWNGRIDQLGLWKRALSAAELTQIYNGGNGLSWPWAPDFYSALPQMAGNEPDHIGYDILNV